MALFSQRKGIRPLQKSMQRESIDADLRNGLWSAVKITVWDNWSPRDVMGYQRDDARRVERTVEAIWLHYFKKPVDTIPNFTSDIPKSGYERIREYFFNAEWWEAYDFIEFLIKATDSTWARNLVES